MTSFWFFIGISFGYVFFYPISFYELEPAYLCRNKNDSAAGSLYSCTSDEWCNNPDLIVTIDWEDPESLHNWIEKMDIACASGS
jgi:hypothetical protein